MAWMTASQVAQRFQSSRKIGRDKWQALCPAHLSRNPSLRILAGDRWVILKCMSHGCDVKDIIAAVGLRMRDLAYNFRDDASWRLAEVHRKKQEETKHRIRIGEWIICFARHGYTKEDRESDITAICAAALVLSSKITPHWERIFRTHMERIEAADHCRMRGMLPNVK